jgi:hypothetical protein
MQSSAFASIGHVSMRRSLQPSSGLNSVCDLLIGREMKNEFRYASLAIFTVMVSIVAVGRAGAHDHDRPELNNWYESLRSGKGPCCDGSDAQRVDDADWESKDGHYRVRINGEWVDVPKEAVVDGPNRAGRAMVWPYYQDGHPKPRCFMPGSMS